MLPRRASFRSRSRSWLLPGTQLDYEVFRSIDVREEDAARPRVAGVLAAWHLERWLSVSRATLCSLYEALGGSVRLGLSSLERTRFERDLQQRLERAFLQGELVVSEVPRTSYRPPPFLEEAPAAVAPSRPRPPPPAPPEPAVELDVAAQVRVLRQAAAEGTPFCEECEKKRQQQRQRAA
jgi:hypothetical protein